MLGKVPKALLLVMNLGFPVGDLMVMKVIGEVLGDIISIGFYLVGSNAKVFFG